MQILVIGLGNELLADEGVGVHAVRCLQKAQLPVNVVILEVGTAMLNAVSELEHAERIIVIDAMKGGELPGTVYKVALDECSGNMQIASLHGFDIFRVLALAGRSDVPPVTVFGVEPMLIDWSMALSSVVDESLPALLKAVMSDLRNEPSGPDMNLEVINQEASSQ